MSNRPDHYPEGYLDGCTIGPQKFGEVSHKDICLDHDEDWWNVRTFIGKIWSDLKWAGRLIARHSLNFPFQFPAVLFAVIGFVGLNTLGWVWWMKRQELKANEP